MDSILFFKAHDKHLTSPLWHQSNRQNVTLYHKCRLPATSHILVTTRDIDLAASLDTAVAPPCRVARPSRRHRGRMMCPLIMILDRYDRNWVGRASERTSSRPLPGQKHESDVGTANIRRPASVEPLNCAVGRVAAPFCVAEPLRVGSVSHFRSAPVDDSQTSGVRCPRHSSALLQSLDWDDLVLGHGLK